MIEREDTVPYLYLDATFVDARWARSVENVSALVAYDAPNACTARSSAARRAVGAFPDSVTSDSR